MIIAAFALFLGLDQAPDAPILLDRRYALAESSEYRVHSQMQVERRGGGLRSWMPQDLEISYRFTTKVQKSMADGIVQLRYRRPQMVFVDGESFASQAERRIDRSELVLDLTMSPFNRVLELNRVTGISGNVANVNRQWMSHLSTLQEGDLGLFISDLYRLAVFAGSFDTALDLAPPLPLSEVQVGDTWANTVGYQPQRLKGEHGRQAVQRLDFRYTYKGRVKVGSVWVHRIEGKLDLDTDLSEFFHQSTGTTPSETGLRRLPVTLTANVTFDLHLQTRQTLRATGTTRATVDVFTAGGGETPSLQERLRATTTMSLVGNPKE